MSDRKLKKKKFNKETWKWQKFVGRGERIKKIIFVSNQEG